VFNFKHALKHTDCKHPACCVPLFFPGTHNAILYALLTAAQNRQDAALDYLEKALDYWCPEAQPILAEPLFKKIRKTKRFRVMMAKHFPDQTKD